MASIYYSNVDIIKIENFTGNEIADMVIISGGSNIPSIMYDLENYDIIINFIKSTNIPIFGICLGCELIARAFGCDISDSGIKIIGTQNICFVDDAFCLEELGVHKFFIKNISKEIKILATGVNNSIEVISHISRPIIRTQFHSEVSQNGLGIFAYLLKEIVVMK